MNNRRIKLRLACTAMLALGGWASQGGSHIASASGTAKPVAALDIANIPRAFSYQGTLRLADGSLANGSYNVTLRIYTTVTGGSAIHTESFTNTVARNGAFSVVMGDATPISTTVFDNANLYLGITVAPDAEMLPRQRLFPVPWAMQAAQAAQAVQAVHADAATSANTLVADATVNGVVSNKGAANVPSFMAISSGPGWGSGMQFQNTAGPNRTYGMYVSQDGTWWFVDNNAGAGRFWLKPDDATLYAQNLYSYGNIAAVGTVGANTVSAGIGGVSTTGNVVALGKVYATQGFNGYCRGSGPIDVRCDQDVAETFATDERIEAGNVVVFIPEDRALSSVKVSSRPYEGPIVGVVSTNPGLVFDQGETHLAGPNDHFITDKKTVVAMIGRVLVKFSLENGPIAIGDPLTSGSLPGTAMKATKAGQIIGYAMESSAVAKDGKVLVWLQLGTYIPQDALDALNALVANK